MRRRNEIRALMAFQYLNWSEEQTWLYVGIQEKIHGTTDVY